MQEDGIPEEEYDFGELQRGRRYKRKKTRVEKGEPHSDPEGREPCTLVWIVEIPYIGGEEEEL
jgi:hypothetical protein